jgi:hypothetical protein
MKQGWYGASRVKLPIQAPLTPRLNKTSGKIQQDEAASAPRRPPAAINPCHGRTSATCFSCSRHGFEDASCSDYRIKDYFMPAITSSRADNFPIGALSKAQRRERRDHPLLRADQDAARRRRAAQTAVASIARPTFAFLHSYGARANSGFHSMKSAPCSAWEHPARHPAGRLRRSPRITSKTSGRRFPISRSSSVCWRKRSPGVQETEFRIAPYWIFSIFGDRNNRPGTNLSGKLGDDEGRYCAVRATKSPAVKAGLFVFDWSILSQQKTQAA